jgi:hypothetical protein
MTLRVSWWAARDRTRRVVGCKAVTRRTSSRGSPYSQTGSASRATSLRGRRVSTPTSSGPCSAVASGRAWAQFRSRSFRAKAAQTLPLGANRSRWSMTSPLSWMTTNQRWPRPIDGEVLPLGSQSAAYHSGAILWGKWSGSAFGSSEPIRLKSFRQKQSRSARRLRGRAAYRSSTQYPCSI